jgi:hypothetical protein
VLAEPSFQLTDALALGHGQRLGCARRRFPNLQRQRQVGQLHGPGYSPLPPTSQAPVSLAVPHFVVDGSPDMEIAALTLLARIIHRSCE